MTIYEIKQRTATTSPYFFSRKTLKFFGQTMRSFSVRKINKSEKYFISAPMKDRTGKIIGSTQGWFNTVTNELEMIDWAER